MAEIFQRKMADGTRSPMWSSNIRIGGKQVMKALSTKKSEAKIMLAALIEEQRQMSGKQRTGDGMSFLRLQQLMLEETISERRPATLRINKRALRDTVSLIPITKASQFTPDWLERVKRLWVEKGKVTIDPNTKIASGVVQGCNRQIRAIKAMARMMEQKEVIGELPWRKVSGFKVFRGGGRNLKFFETAEQKLLESGAAGIYLTLHQLGVEAGLRCGEIRHLWLENVDFENGKIQVRAKHWEEDGVMKYWTPKGDDQGEEGKERDVPMSTKLRDYLLALKQMSRSKWVMAEPSGNVPTPDSLSHGYGKLVKRLGLNQGRRCIHALRHSFAVNYMRKGGNIYKLKEHMGHASVTTTEIYATFGQQGADPIFDRVVTQEPQAHMVEARA